MKTNRYTYLLTLLICIYPAVSIYAQGICASSALAPVYSQDFGTSTSSSKKSAVPSGFTTKYSFNGSSALSDGQYMVTPLVQNGGKSDWATGGDHTGNTNGNMYLINAGKPSSGPVDLFFSTQVDNLCPGSVYSFSAWLVNVNTTSKTVPICGTPGPSGTIPAKVTFNIKNTSGTILQSYTTPDLPLTANTSVAPNWQQYGFQFTLPSGTTSLILEMRDALGGLASYCGNDFAVDDILFSACTPTATVTLSTASVICSGTNTTITSSIVNSPYSNPAYQWQKSTDGGTTWVNIGTPGTSASNFPINSAAVSDGGMYRVIVGPDVSSLSSASCTTASNSISLTVNPSPAVTIGSNSPLCSGNTLNLTASPVGGTTPYTSYAWSGPNGFTSSIQNPSIASSTTAASGTYTFTITDSKSCTATVTADITVNQTPSVAAITNISGNTGGCTGSSYTLSDATGGGVWSSSNTAVATVSNSGLVTITGGGTATISYTVSNAGCSAATTVPVTGASVTLHPDVIECNNGIAHFDATDTYYGVTYSNSNAGNSYLWLVSGGPFTFQGSSNASSQYPGMQMQTGSSYQVIIQFTTGGLTCSDTQMVYKNVVAADTIQGSHDTTVCYNTGPISLSGKVSPVTNLYSWSTTGTGVFSNPNALNTTYTPSAADKSGAAIKIYLSGSSTLNATGNCGSSTAKDSMILRVYPDNTATNTTQTICSNQVLNFTPTSTIAGSTYSWNSSVSSGSLTGNTASGTDNIIDSLVNLSVSAQAVVLYTITPYAFTPSNKTCTGTPFTLTVTVNPKPVVTITNNAPTICTGSSANIQFSSSVPGSNYTWSSQLISGSGSGNSSNAVASATAQITDVLTSSANTNALVRYYITAVTAAGCNRIDSTDVLVTGVPTIANAGPDQAVCNVTTALLAGNSPVLGTGTWSMVSGPSSISFGSASSGSGTINGLIPGTYQLEWRISNGSCAASTDTVVIVNAPQTVAGTLSSDATVCAGNNTGTITLGGNTGAVIRWESSVDAGATWGSIANTTSSLTYNNLSATTLYRAVVQSDACSIAYSNPVTITVNPQSIPGVVTADATVCTSSNSGTLILTGYTGSISQWESSTDNGATWSPIANATSSLTYLNLNTTTQYKAAVKSGTCTAVYSNAVTITVSPQTVPGVIAASASVCATANAGAFSLTGSTGSVLQWESSADNGATWNTIGNTSNTQSYTNLTGNTLYRALVQSGACPALYTNNVTITVLQPVTIASAGTDQTLCNSSSALLAANTPTSGTGTWTNAAGNPTTATFTNPVDPASTVNGLVPGTYRFIWTISNGLCADSKDTVQIIVSPQTVPGTVAANATVCATTNAGTLSLTGSTGSVQQWESSTDNGTSWTSIANTSASLSYNNLSATTLFRASVKNSVCPALYSNNVTITVLQPVTIASAGADQTLCNSSSALLAANTPTSGTGTWTNAAGNPTTASFTNPVDPASTVNGLVPGTYQFIWTISNGLCADSKDTVQIIVSPQTVPGTVAASATVCATANAGTLSLTGSTGSVQQWESSTDNGTAWTSIANTSASLSYNNLSATTLFRASVKNSVCPALYSNNVTITVLQPVTIANAGTDQTLCNSSSALLAANTPTSGTGTWTNAAGNPTTATFTNPVDPASTVNGLVPGTYRFIWTISNGLCADSKDTVQIIVSPQTVPGTVAASATVCATANAGTLSLTGSTGSVQQWESSTDNGTSWTSIANTSASLSYNNLSATTLFRASVKNSVCPALYSNNVTITVLQPVTIASAGADQTLCNSSSALLAANTPTSGTGTWTNAAGNPTTASFTNPVDPASTVNGLVPGTYQFIWTISNGLCADSKDTVQIIVSPQTVPGTVAASATVCATANAGTLSLTGSTGSVQQWESSTDNGNSWTSIANTSASLSYNNLSATTVFRASVKNSVCPALYSNNVTITVLQPVTIANAGTDQALCNVTSATLAGNTPTSGTGTWTNVVGNPTTATFSNPNYAGSTVNGLVPGTYQFVWTISNGVCSNSTDIVQIIVYPATVPGIIASDATVCATSNAGTLSLTGYSSTVLGWESSTDNGTTWNPISNTSSSLTYTNLGTTTQYRASVQNAVCPALYSNVVKITVMQPVTVSNAGPSVILVNGVSSYKLGANTPTSGTGVWTILPGGPSSPTLINAADPATTIGGLTYNAGTPPTDGIYHLQWTISNGYCPSSTSAMQITVQPPTNPGVIGPDAVVCTGSNHGTLQLSDYLGDILQWEYSTDYGANWTVIASTVGTNQDTYDYNNLTTTTLFRALVKNGVGASLYSGIAATVTVLELVTPSNAGPDQTLCNTTTTVLAANTPTSGTGTWSAVAGNPTATTFGNPADPHTVVNGMSYGTYQFVWTISNGICSNSVDTVNITIAEPTIAGVIAADATVCANNNSGTLSISGFKGDIVGAEASLDNGITWTIIAGTVSQTAYTYNNLPGTTQFRASVKNSVCPALYTNIVTITTMPAVTPAAAGTDQALCNVTSATLAANTPASGTGTWTSDPANPSAVTFINSHDPNTTINGLTAGSYQFIWTISNALCADSKDTVTIIVYPPTVAGSLIADATVCATANAGTLSLTGHTGNVLQWEASINNGVSWSPIANTAASLNYNNLTATTQYRASVQNAVCPAQYSNIVTINVVQPVTPAAAGPDQALCNVTSATLDANTPASGTGTWTSDPANPSAVTFTNSHDPNTTINGLTAGSYQFIWTISNALCADSKDTVTIIVYPPTVAGSLIADATVCATANAGTLSLTGYTGNILQWESSADNGVSWSPIANTAASLNYNNLTATTQYRASVQNAICPTQYSNIVTINVVQPVTPAAAGTDQALCNVTSATLAANTPASGTGSWISDPANPSAVTFTNSHDPNTTINGLIAGSYQFIWTISNALCADSKDTVTIVVYPPTVAGSLVADATVCATANAGTLSLTGYTGTILQWETSADNGVFWNPIANTAASFNYNNLTATTQYRASVQNAVCPAQYSNIVTINVVQPVTPAAASTDQALCNVTSATLAANTPTSGTGTWTSDPANPSAVTFTNSHDPNTTINGLIAGSYQFFWTISNALCADSKDTVTIIVYPPTVAGSLIADATVCATANAGTLSLTGYTGNILQWESSADNGVSWNPISNTAASLNYNNLTATTQYRASVQNAICPAQYSNIVTINVVQPVTPAAAGTDQALCNVTSATLAANTPTSGTGTWTSDPANPSAVTFTNSHDPNTTINGLTAGSYQFIWTISNALCADSKDTVTIIVYPPTVAGSLIADATVCATANAGTLSLTGYTGNILQWESSADNGATWSIINNQAANYPFSNLAVTTIYRALVQSGNCNAVYSNMVTITVNPATIGGKLVATSNAICAGSNSGTVQLSAFTGVIQHWETSVDSGKTWNIIAHSDTSYDYNSIVTDTWYRVLIQSSPCVVAYSDTAKIVVNQPTVAGILSGPKVVCNGINNGTLTIKGQTGDILHWEMSTDAGVSWNIINSTADTLNYLNLTQTSIYRALVQNGVCAMMYTNNIVITVIDPVTIADAGPDQLICNGRSIVTLAANTPVSGAGSWSLVSGPTVPSFDNTSLPNATVSGLSTGTYVFAWTISNGTCASSTDTVEIRIDKITPAFNISGVNNCGATIYSFNNTSEAAFGIKNWLWYNSNGDTLKQKDISFTYTKEGYRDMTLSIQSNTGCTNSLQALYKVTVFQFPKVNINAIADACKSQLLKLTPQINSQDSIAYLLWNLGNGTRTKDSIVTVQYVKDGNYTLKLTVATVNNCFDSAYKQITIHPIPDISINSSPIVCKGDSLVLVASGASNYVWTDKDNNIICDGCSTTRVKPVYNITYKVLGYSQYGCSQVKTTEVRVIQPLKMLITSGDTVCVGQSKQLMVVGADQYQWYPGTGLSSTKIASPVAKPDVTTTYHVIGKDNYNCFADTAELKMVVGYPTAINIGKDTVITAGSVFRLNAISQTRTSDIRKWYWNSPVPLSCNNCATPELRVSDNINISCLAINRYGCTSVDTIHIQTFCPTTQVFIPNAFSPDGDGINDLLIVQGSGIKMVKSFRIFNRWGEMVFEKTNFRPGDPAYGWDGKIRGKAAPPDVFVYMCEVICEKGIPSMFKGNVAILK